MADTDVTFPTDADFEEWDDERMEAALAALADSFKVKSVIGGGTMFCKFPQSGRVYRLPISLSIRQSEALMADSDAESFAALKGLIATVSPEDAEAIEAEPMQSVADMLGQFGKAIQRTQGVPLGK